MGTPTVGSSIDGRRASKTVPRSRLAAAIIAITLVAAVAEIGSYLVSMRYLRRTAPYLFYDLQPAPSAATIDAYLKQRDPILGWPSPTAIGTESVDRTGSRRLPSFPAPGGACVSLYGDSFTWSEDASDDDAWGNVLARRLGCRVANYGVPGYGIDQAYLRFVRNTRDEAPVSVLTVYPEDVLRDVNQNRMFLTGGRDAIFGFKPRFILNARGGLELVPLPTVATAAFEQFLQVPGRYLAREYFLPESTTGPRRFRFPFSWFAFQAFRQEQMAGALRSALRGPPSWSVFFSPDHPSGSLPLASAILQAFDREARAQGRTPVLLILPTAAAVRYHAATGRWAYQTLIDRLARGGIELINTGDAFNTRLNGRPYCEMLAEPQPCRGHYSPAGYAMLADIVFERLQRTSVVPPL